MSLCCFENLSRNVMRNVLCHAIRISSRINIIAVEDKSVHVSRDLQATTISLLNSTSPRQARTLSRFQAHNEVVGLCSREQKIFSSCARIVGRSGSTEEY